MSAAPHLPDDEGTEPAFDYDAFISYKRSDGTRAARWLRRRLLSYRLPRALRDRWPRKLSVYLDTVYEKATEDFFERNIKPALMRSRHLIVVLTPAVLAAAERQGDWVAREVREFGGTSQGRNLIVVTAPGVDILEMPWGLAEQFPHLEIVSLRDLTPERFWRWSRWWGLRDELLKVAAPLCRIPTVDMPALRGEERNRALRILGATSTLLSVVLAAMTVLTVLAYRNYLAAESSRRAEHAAQVRTLLDAHPQAVPDIIKSLPANADVLDRLRVLWTTPWNQDERPARTRAGLALHALVPQASAGVTSQLLDWMADAADPQEVLLIRSELSRDAAGLVEGLWKKVEAAQTPREQRFRQLVGLAAFDPSNRRWAELGPELAAALVQTNPLYLPVWTEAFRPVKSVLIAPLVAHFSGRTPDGRRYAAATLLATYGADSVELLVRLLETADAEQYQRIFPLLATAEHRQAALEALRRKITVLPAASGEGRSAGAAEDDAARAQAQLAVALLRLAPDDSVWSLLTKRADPTVRSHLVHALGPLRADASLLLQRLQNETDVSARRSLILSLGEFSSDQLTPQQRQDTIALLLRWYESDPDPGVHSAVDWLLRHGRRGSSARPLDWQAAGALKKLERRLAGEPHPGRNWYINHTGDTMAIVRGPSTSWLARGGTDDDPAFRKQIRRSFAIATTEVTIAQFRAFQSSLLQPEALKYAPDEEAPILGVTWFEAALYCNWLSRREGRPPCYTRQLAGEAMNINQDLLSQPCYRLPTEAEWEAAARAGSPAPRFYGASSSLLGQYAWYQQSSGDRAWPVGQLKPNDLGLFDVYGNAEEWTQQRAGVVMNGQLRSDPFLEQRRSNPKDDEEDSILVVTPDSERVLKGGSFNERDQRVSSGARNFVPPGVRALAFGFRVATTLGTGVPAKQSSQTPDASRTPSAPALQIVVDHANVSFRSASRFAWPQKQDLDLCMGRLQYDGQFESGMVVAEYSPSAPPLRRLPRGFTELSVEPPTTDEAFRDLGICLRGILSDATADQGNVSARIPFRVVEASRPRQ